MQIRNDRCDLSFDFGKSSGPGKFASVQFSSGVTMTCKRCASSELSRFTSELCIHRTGLKNLTESHLLYPHVIICLNCGYGQFGVQDLDLERLRKARSAGAA